jgi:hypothetical protein
VATVTDPPSKSNSRKRKRKLTQPWALVITAIIATAGTTFVATRAAAPNNTPAPAHTPSAKATTLAVPLGFSQKSPATIPWCNTFDGPGSIPAGDSLLLFDVQTQPNGQPLSGALYFFDGAVKGPTSTSWTFSPVYIGEKGDVRLSAALDGILVSNQTADFIKSIVVYATKFPWKSRQLPPGIVHIHLDLIRDADESQCG